MTKEGLIKKYNAEVIQSMEQLEEEMQKNYSEYRISCIEPYIYFAEGVNFNPHEYDEWEIASWYTYVENADPSECRGDCISSGWEYFEDLPEHPVASAQ